MQQIDNFNSSQITSASNKGGPGSQHRKEKIRHIPQKFSKKTQKKIGFDSAKLKTLGEHGNKQEYANLEDDYQRVLGEYEEIKLILGTRFKK